MSFNPVIKGYLFAFLATVATSNVYIFSKAALNEIHITQFGFYWFGMALLFNLFYTIRTRKYKTLKTLSRKTITLLVIIGLIEIVSTTSFYMAIQTVEHPAIVSFLSNIGPVLVVLISISFLHERFKIVEIFGIILTLAGAFIISYNKDASMSGYFIKGMGFILITSLAYAIKTIVIKRNIKNIDPCVLAANRSVYLFVVSCIMMLAYQQSFVISGFAFMNTAVGAFIGPFLTTLLIYNSLKYIEASRYSAIMSSNSLFVLIGAYIYFNTLPFPYQIAGGVISMIGVIMLSVRDIIRNYH